MITTQTIKAVRLALSEARIAEKRIGLVPTMGYLHEGHLSLVDEARKRGADLVVVSIFVNPAQFGPNEDFSSYPRDEARDSALLQARGVDLLFLPSVAEIYPPDFSTSVTVGGVSEPLEGERRPGHFAGVATVVMKLLNIVRPDLAVFGEKDAQQCAVIRKMVNDLAIDVELVFSPTVREGDGLALSSRNAYLNETQRALAVSLNRALREGQQALRSGNRFADVESAMSRTLALSEGVQEDYLRVVDPLTFLTPQTSTGELLLVGAARVGATRLIDNIRIPSQSASEATGTGFSS